MSSFKLFGTIDMGTQFSRNLEIAFDIKSSAPPKELPRLKSNPARESTQSFTSSYIPSLQTNGLSPTHTLLSREVPSLKRLPLGETPSHTDILKTSLKTQHLSQMTHWGPQPLGTEKLLQDAQIRQEADNTLNKISLSPEEEKIYLAQTIALNALPFMTPKEAINIAMEGYQGTNTHWPTIASKFYDHASLTLTMNGVGTKNPKLTQQDLVHQREKYIEQAQVSPAKTSAIQTANTNNIDRLPEDAREIVETALIHKNISNDPRIAQYNLAQNPAGKVLLQWLDKNPDLKILHSPGVRIDSYPESVDFFHSHNYFQEANTSLVAGSVPSHLNIDTKKNQLRVRFTSNNSENTLLSADGTQKLFTQETTLGHEIVHAYQGQWDRNSHELKPTKSVQENHAVLVERILQYYGTEPRFRFPIYAANNENRHEHLNTTGTESSD